MSQPVAYNPTKDFSAAEAAAEAGRSTVDTTALDTEHTNIATTISQIRTNLAILQRDDTKLQDKIVELHTLSAEVLALIASTWTPKGAWVTATPYSVGDLVTAGTPEDAYVCVTAHTAGTFATDLAAGYWMVIRGVGYAQLASTATGLGASLIGIEDAAALFAATNVEGALAEIFTIFASTATSKGAALVGVEDSPGNFTGTNVEAVLAEIITQLASTATGQGASKIGIEDPATIFASSNVEAALAEIFTILASTATSKGASLISIEDAGGYTATTQVEAALAEIYASLVAINAILTLATVTGFTAGRWVYFDTDTTYATLDLDNSLTKNLWTSVGPTGSGATYEWTDLDALPANAKAIIVRPFGYINDTAGGIKNVDIEARATGNGLGSPYHPLVYADIYTKAGAATYIPSSGDCLIPLDGNLAFEAYWNHGANSSQDLWLLLIGFVV